MNLLRLEDFSLLPTPEIGRDARLRESFLNLAAMLGNRRYPQMELNRLRKDRFYFDEFNDTYHCGLVQHATGDIVARTIVSVLPFQGKHAYSDSQVHPDRRGQGIGSILLAKTVQLMGQLCHPCLSATIDNENPASWRRFDKLVTHGLARRVYKREDGGPHVYREYDVPTAHPVAALHAALAEPSPTPAVRRTPREQAMAVANQLRR